MQMRAVWKRMRGWMLVLAFACLAVALFALNQLLKSAERGEKSCEAASRAVVPAGKRHEGLDVGVLQGLRLQNVLGCRRIEVGSFGVRKMAMGFIRIGAFNEAVVNGLRVTVDNDFFTTSNEVVRAALRIQPPPAQADGQRRQGQATARPAPSGRGFSVARSSTTGLVSQVFGVLWQYSPCRDQRVSGFVIQDLSLLLAVRDGEDLCLLRCRSAAPWTAGAQAHLILRGDVVFRNTLGETLRCEEARLVFAEPPLVHVQKATILSPGSTGRVDRISFPLRSLADGRRFEN